MSTAHTDALRELLAAVEAVESYYAREDASIASGGGVELRLGLAKDSAKQALASSPTVAPADERIAFEVSERSGKIGSRTFSRHSLTGEYIDDRREMRWQGWSARASLDQPHSGETPT